MIKPMPLRMSTTPTSAIVTPLVTLPASTDPAEPKEKAEKNSVML